MKTRKIKETNHKRYSIIYSGYSNRSYVCCAEEALIQFISIKIFMTWCILRLFCCRVGCMVASMKDINVSAVVCLGYPLKVWFSCQSLNYGINWLHMFFFLLLLPWGSRCTEEDFQLFAYHRVYYTPCLIFIFSIIQKPLIPFVSDYSLITNF